MNQRVLVIEDDPSMLEGLVENLVFEGYDVLVAENGRDGFRMATEDNPDLIILDLMLPGLNGFEICRKVRALGIQTPVLMLTARREEMDRVMGLDLGADDYVVKPFSVAELLARVRAQLRRASNGNDVPLTVSFADVIVDFERFEATRSGQKVELTPKEFGLLRALAAQPGKVLTRESLLEDVWGHDIFPTTRTVDTHVSSLRSKLEKDPSAPQHLITVHGIGYKLQT